MATSYAFGRHRRATHVAFRFTRRRASGGTNAAGDHWQGRWPHHRPTHHVQLDTPLENFWTMVNSITGHHMTEQNAWRAMRQPNILYFFSDQQRWDTCGCYGSRGHHTNLDRMAAEGVRFEHAYTCQPSAGRRAHVCRRANTPRKSVATRTQNAAGRRADDRAHSGGSGLRGGLSGKWHLASTGPLEGPDDFRTRPVRQNGVAATATSGWQPTS